MQMLCPFRDPRWRTVSHGVLSLSGTFLHSIVYVHRKSVNRQGPAIVIVPRAFGWSTYACTESSLATVSVENDVTVVKLLESEKLLPIP